MASQKEDMRNIFNFLFSSRFTAVLLFVFGYMIAIATFIENQYGTPTANIEIFRSKWLELILVLLAINFIGNIKKYQMISLKKWPSLVFHLAFVIIIIGAGVTRYFGFEGIMPIREGQTSQTMYSGEPHLQLTVLNPKMDPKNPQSRLRYLEPHLMAATTDNDFKVLFPMGEQEVEFTYADYIENADYEVFENVQGGTDVLEVVTTSEGARKSIYIASGDAKNVGRAFISFNAPEVQGAVSIIEKGDSFLVYSPFVIPRMRMRDRMQDTVVPGVVSKMDFAQMHVIEGTQVVFKRKMTNTIVQLVSRENETELGDALKIKVKIGELETEEYLFGGSGKIGVTHQFEFGGMYIKGSYGSIPMQVPFKLRLDDFIMETYPGSENPSGYRSKVTLIDDSIGLVEPREIFMNNVLDYGGYRFFQSSFDKDLKGTVLSVNNDAWGTNITYIGYLLLGLGFVLTLLNKNSRFFGMPKKIRALRNKRIGLTAVLVFVSLFGFSQQEEVHDEHDGHDHSGHNHSHQEDGFVEQNARSQRTQTASVSKNISLAQAKAFGELIVQSANGRFEPVNTLAYDLVHKISKQDEIVVDGKVFSAEQFLLELMINGTYFEDKRIIKVSDDSLRIFLGVTEGKYASFLDFFENRQTSKLKEPLMAATAKDPKKRNRWDKEVIKIADKLEAFNLAERGELLRLFPSMDSTKNNKWINVWEEEASVPLKILFKGIYDTNGLPSEASYAKIFSSYLIGLHKGDTASANSYLSILKSLQRKVSDPEIIPSEDKIGMEISYNSSGIFTNIKKGYMYLSVFLLIFALIEAMVSTRDTVSFKFMVQTPLKLFFLMFIGVFVYHTYGLVVRWYLTGHAPWSNGYEALIFIAWGTVLSGIIFSRLSSITAAGTAFVAFLIIMTAGHENMDPQLTPLVPVLKSYWLIIHVACITTSYGFFGLGAILGIIVMSVMLFKNNNNSNRVDLLTSELTFINEMTVTIGVILAAVGTFLGGVWANESWGRYWGWDAKETWALIIVIAYAMLLHFRFIPGFIRSKFFFNAWGTVIGFGTVCMTFFGVNFYFSNSVHSYAAGDPPAFPIWVSVTIGCILLLCVLAGIKEFRSEKKIKE